MPQSNSDAQPELPAIPVQIVFQGGGAKICVLMAVAEVLKRFAAKNRIVINRVAGTSAGAIAAVMLASNRPIEIYKERIKAVAPPYLNRTNVNKWRGFYRLVRGNAFFNKLSLEKFFDELFCQNEKIKTVADLEKPVELYFTDLYSLDARVAPKDEPIPKALANSCRIPFAFVGYSAGNTAVDGGLALNLPVDRLKRDESTNGRVIGVSFKSTFGEAGKTGLLSYTQQLFNAAIQSGVARSEAFLGPQNVFQIDTEIETFDFDTALNDGLKTHYNLVAAQFETWLDNWLKPFGPREPRDSSHKLIRPPLSNIPLAPAIIRELDDRLKSEPCTHAVSVRTFETAILDDQNKFAGRYRARNVMTFAVTRRTNILQFNFQSGKASSFIHSNLGCTALDSLGRPLQFVPDVQDITRPSDSLRTYRMYFLFDRQLVPDSEHQPYMIEFQYEAEDSYPFLGKRPEISSLTRWQGDADEMILAVAFPRAKLGPNPKHFDLSTIPADRLAEYDFSVDPGEELIPSEELHLSTFVSDLMLNHTSENFFLVGRKARNVKIGQTFGLAVE